MNNNIYSITLHELRKSTEDVYLSFLNNNMPDTPQKLKVTYKVTYKKIKRSPEFKKIITDSIAICTDIFINKKPSNSYKEGKEFPSMLEMLKDYIDTPTKDKIAKNLTFLLPKFYPYARNKMLDIAVDWVNNEQDALDILENHYRSLDSSIIDILVEKVQLGYEHPTIKKLTNKGIKFKARKFAQADLNNPEVRKVFLNNIADTPSLLNKIPQEIHLTLEDLKCLPPARRFKFIQTVFEPTIKRFKRRYTYNHYSYSLKTTPQQIATKLVEGYSNPTEDAWFKKISIDDITYEDLEVLLFSISIKKNAELKNWMDRYKVYAEKRKEVRAILENALRWV